MSYARTLIALTLMLAAGKLAEAQQLSQFDQAKIAVQQICPISGQRLGTHGTPIKAKIGEEEVFLCCKSCLKGQVNPQHWATIHDNFKAAQAKCPVMDKPLPKNPKWTIVNGQIFFICCPPCSKKIAAEPAKYMAEVQALYTASLRKQQPQR